MATALREDKWRRPDAGDVEVTSAEVDVDGIDRVVRPQGRGQSLHPEGVAGSLTPCPSGRKVLTSREAGYG